MNRAVAPTQGILREFCFILFYRKKVIMTTFVVIASLCFAAAILLPSRYQSASKFIISLSQQLDPLKRGQGWDMKNEMIREIQNQKEIIFSQNVLERVLAKIDPDLPSDKAIAKINGLRQRIAISPPKGESFEASNVFYLTVEGPTAHYAQQVALALSEAYLGVFSDISRQRASYSYDFFKDQTAKLAKEMDMKGQKLRRYEVRHATNLGDIRTMESGGASAEIGPKALHTNALAALNALRQRREKLQITIQALERSAKENVIPVILPEMEGSGKILMTYRSKIAQLELDINVMKTRYTSDYQPLKQIEQELQRNIASLRNEYIANMNSMRVELQTVEAEISRASLNIAEFESLLASNAQERSTYQRLLDDYKIAKDAYLSANAKLEQARLASSVSEEKQNLTLIEAPQLPSKPFKPNRFVIALMGVICGLVFGVGIAIALDYFDQTIKTPEDIEHALDVKCLGAVSTSRPQNARMS
jgi:uncharacterized protein involved in exopolysaccharide biosynthesis